jgi:prepilin-type N-terminal cleavage/methylation domain-containing protein
VDRNESGLTLIELLIAITISSIALGLAYGTYSAQQRAYRNEQLVIDMQQSARSGMAFMRREIRMADYNPCTYNADPVTCTGVHTVDGFTVVRGDQVTFSFDLNRDGKDDGDNEYITYRFKDENDADHDGIADTGAADLFRYNRKNSSACSVLAFDIHAVAFAYAFDNDGDGQLDTFPGNPDVVIWAYDSDGNGTLDSYLDTNRDGVIDTKDAPNGRSLTGDGITAAEVPLANVRAVQIWLLARTHAPVSGHTETETYVVGPKHIAPNDRYQRALMNGIAMVRNPRT